jgi:hypothetical protein
MIMITTTQDLVAEALFVSDLQPSETPTPQAVQSAISRMLQRYGAEGCAACVATEFGDHPETAVRRMSWVRQVLATV